MSAYAHSCNALGERHLLADHLRRTAELAEEFAGHFGARSLASCAGLLHDLGKIHPAFQRYIEDPQTARGPDHSSAGALLGLEHYELLAFIIAGHHGGIPALTDLKIRLREKKKDGRVIEAQQLAKRYLELSLCGDTPAPSFLKTASKRQQEFFIRMLFSSLVDADFLDTEAHFSPNRAGLRGSGKTLQELFEKLEFSQGKLISNSTGHINKIRREVYQACLAGAELEPGLFRLTVPTGGGKTRSSLGFALKHCVMHGMRRVIVGIPYTSIIEQTADVYYEILGRENILEHHSAVTFDENPNDPNSHELRLRLASENWDAPVVVTTTVQLFESLFASKSSRCRKLHNIAQSVLILDEVQTLPTDLLAPILDVLSELSRHYGVSIVLSTATQPALDDSPILRGLKGVREIIPNPDRYFLALKRVEYELPLKETKWSWDKVAAEMRKSPQSLAVVNTKDDTAAIMAHLDDNEALHLSTRLCGAHRRKVLEEVRMKLHQGRPCRLVSTQCVEAGVDLDFPLVLRAVGPLDRIIQAAGRCNREGKLSGGKVIVFDPEDGRSPPGSYRTGLDIARIFLQETETDLHDPSLFLCYFKRYYASVELDSRGIQNLRESLNFPEVARKFQLIPEYTVPVVVNYERAFEVLDHSIDSMNAGSLSPRELMRRLQPYLVSLPGHDIERIEEEGLIVPVLEGLWKWKGIYDEKMGLTEHARDPIELAF